MAMRISLLALPRLHYLPCRCHRSLAITVRPVRLPITPTLLWFIHRHLSGQADNYDIVCTWAACCLAFSAFLWSEEFTCTSWDFYDRHMLSLVDIAIDSHTNPTILHINLWLSKTDVVRAGVTIHLGRTGDTLCPVAALLAYLACRLSTEGPLLLQSGEPLSWHKLVTAVQQVLSSTGLDVSRFNGHSFRVVAATAAAEAGLADSAIQQLGWWKSSAYTRYLRPPVDTIAASSWKLLSNHTLILLLNPVLSSHCCCLLFTGLADCYPFTEALCDSDQS